jgi:hypothetical protein
MRLPCDVLRERLSVYLGPNTARTALKTFAQRALNLAPESLDAAQARNVLAALRPMLKVLLGPAECDRVVAKLEVELALHA